MDPVACLERLDAAMAALDRQEIAASADDLISWLEKGGFMPCGPNGCDWRGYLTPAQLTSMLRNMRAIAEMR